MRRESTLADLLKVAFGLVVRAQHVQARKTRGRGLPNCQFRQQQPTSSSSVQHYRFWTTPKNGRRGGITPDTLQVPPFVEVSHHHLQDLGPPLTATSMPPTHPRSSQPESQRERARGRSPWDLRPVTPSAGLPGREAAGAAVEGILGGARGPRQGGGGRGSEGQAGAGPRVPADVPEALLLVFLHRVRESLEETLVAGPSVCAESCLSSRPLRVFFVFVPDDVFD